VSLTRCLSEISEKFEATFKPALARRPRSLTLNLLIRHWFDIPSHKYVKIILRCNINIPPKRKISADKDFAGELFFPHYFILRGWHSPRSRRRAKMAWNTPKIVEVPVGMEINMYACAARK